MKRTVGISAFAIGLLLGVVLASRFALAAAQSDDCPPAGTPGATATVTTGQRLLGQADYADVPPAPARLTTTQLTLAPGASTQPFANPGPMLIVVQDGTVTLNADAALVGPPPEPQVGISVTVATPEPAAAQDVAVTKGEQISLEANTNAQLRNAGDAPVRLLLVTIVAQPAGA